MPRTARVKSRSGIYHIILRGINRENIFGDDEDRNRFILTMEQCKEKCGYEIYAYCLMSNHVHILLRENNETISQILKRISSSYVHRYNSKYKRCGHLFQERFRSEPVEDDQYFLTVLRYIHQNSLKAGLVKCLEDYKWSSYLEYIRKPRLVDRELGLGLVSQDSADRIEAFKRFNNSINTDVCLELEDKPAGISDKELISVIKAKYGIEPNEIKNEKEQVQTQILRELKNDIGASLRQISKITGFTVYKISKV